MLIKLKNKNVKFLFGLLLVLALSLLSLNKQHSRGYYSPFIIAMHDGYEYLMSLDPGFSSARNLGDPNYSLSLPQPFSEKLTLMVSSIPAIIKYKLAGDNQNFEKIDIDIKFTDYQKIMADRDRALTEIILQNPSWVNAKIKYRGKVYKSKLRLKGDLHGHWLSTYRMSFRIKLRGKGTILGYKKFSSQKPREREHPYDYTYQSMMRKIGNLSAAHNFAHLYVNGTDWGIMDIEEHMSKELLEKQYRKESAIVRFSDDRVWFYKQMTKHPYSNYRLSDDSLHVHLYGSGKYLKNNHFRKMYSYILKHSLNYDSYLYDTDQFTKAYILATAWGTWHTLLNNNIRYYFNPFTLKLEPITTDQAGYLALEDLKNIQYYNALPHQFKSALSTPSYANNLSENLNSVRQVISNTQLYLDSANSFFPLNRKKHGKTVIDNMDKIISNRNKYLKIQAKNTSEDNKPSLVLPTYEQASQFEEHLHVRHYTNGHLELYNLLPDNILVKDILFKGISFLDGELTVPSYLTNSFPVILKTPHREIQDNNITVRTEYKGFDREITNGITLIANNIENPLLLNTAQDVDFLKKSKNGGLEFKKGNWIINNPIIVNGELHIPPGVNIKFSKNTYLLVKGALTATGSVDKPIVLEPLLDSWKGIYVFKANKRSRLNNVIIKNITALEDGLLKLTGGVTFYKSDVDFENVKIVGAEAEDAVNIIKSDFTMNFVRVNSTASDALDSDFSKGTVTQSSFSNIGGDALDFSGSNIKIDQVTVTDARDKAVSGGEKSIINIKNSILNDIGDGIASKDGSDIFISNTRISNYRLHAAMSYIKKDFYGKPSIELVDCEISRGNPFVRQKGTNMVVDNSEISEIEVDVEKLYQNEVMRK